MSVCLGRVAALHFATTQLEVTLALHVTLPIHFHQVTKHVLVSEIILLLNTPTALHTMPLLICLHHPTHITAISC